MKRETLIDDVGLAAAILLALAVAYCSGGCESGVQDPPAPAVDEIGWMPGMACPAGCRCWDKPNATGDYGVSCLRWVPDGDANAIPPDQVVAFPSAEADSGSAPADALTPDEAIGTAEFTEGKLDASVDFSATMIAPSLGPSPDCRVVLSGVAVAAQMNADGFCVIEFDGTTYGWRPDR